MSFRETEVGLIPVYWKVDTMENALEEIIDYRGKTPEKSEAGIKTLSAKSVKDGYIDYSKAYFISKETYEKFMVRGFPKKVLCILNAKLQETFRFSDCFSEICRMHLVGEIRAKIKLWTCLIQSFRTAW
ncbi:hypothetical protein ACWI_20830 [Acetobacterium wieringae]|uniref:Uncharacterized protein n=2 Tax=Eubacteriaceae TaxID=186806 RepID=A0A1F2PHE2_9FIRM|nr:hypothetical protein ACWI_20830 [Acetobacterium wieringae]